MMTAARVTALSVLAIAAVLFTAGAAAERAGQEGSIAPLDDRLATRVELAIGSEPSLATARIDAEASDGVVALRGSVTSVAGRAAALRIARGVPGVKAVRDELRVAA